MTSGPLLKQVDDYYTGRLREHGPTARGVDWNSSASQELRFEQLLRACPTGPCSVLDYGCGYGALTGELERRGGTWDYRGYDVSEAMVEKARELHQGRPWCRFTSDEAALERADVTVASGIFSVKLANDAADWKAYILETLDRLAALSAHAFSFNMLTSYSDADRMRPDLYYADPCFFFDHCKRNYSRQVAVLHDYGLYEFTILVRKDA